ncbi:MAG: hypothetical protein Q4C04_02420 [Clostridia bacterium]|nr:hypothetical protein [Clostridia bacterium]
MNRMFAFDQLNKTLLFTGILAFLARMFIKEVGWVYYLFTAIAVLAMLYFIFRLMNGNNYEKRARENQAFLNFFASLKAPFSKNGGTRRARVVRQGSGRSKKSFSEWVNSRKNYRYLICPQCRQKLRVPRGKGKIKVTCTICRNQFIAKS